GMTNFSTNSSFDDPWVAFALPSGVDVGEELPSGIELVNVSGEYYIAVKLSNVQESGSATRFEDIYLVGDGYEANPNYSLFLAEYTDGTFVFHGELKSQRKIDFDVMDGVPNYNLEGSLSGSTSFDADNRSYTLSITGEVTNNEAVDIEDVYASFTIPEDVEVLENDEDVTILNMDDGMKSLAINIANLQAGETVEVNVDIPVIGKTEAVVEATEIELYKIADGGYWPLASIPGSIKIDFSDMDQE